MYFISVSYLSKLYNIIYIISKMYWYILKYCLEFEVVTSIMILDTIINLSGCLIMSN